MSDFISQSQANAVQNLAAVAHKSAAEYVKVDPRADMWASDVREATDDILQALRQHDQAALGIRTNADLSEQGKRAQLDTVAARIRADLEAAEAKAGEAFDQMGNRARFEPPPFETDRAVGEARLANARSDARLFLDSVPEAHNVPEALRALARETPDEAVRHLVLYSPWSELYLRARGATDASLGVWRHYRDADLAQYLTGDALTQWQRHQATTHLRKSREVVRHMVHFALADRGAR